MLTGMLFYILLIIVQNLSIKSRNGVNSYSVSQNQINQYHQSIVPVISSLHNAGESLGSPSTQTPGKILRSNNLKWRRYASQSGRELGSFEKLFNRKVDMESSRASLSHACIVRLSGQVSHDTLVNLFNSSIVYKNPSLAVKISDDGQRFIPCDVNLNEVISTVFVEEDKFEYLCSKSFEDAMNGPVFPIDGPLWRLTNVISKCALNENRSTSVWIFCMNHAIDDQQSLKIIVSDLLQLINGETSDSNIQVNHSKLAHLPPSMEEAIASDPPNVRTIIWALYQAWNSLQGPTVLPKLIVNRLRKDDSFKEIIRNPNNRRTVVRTFTLDEDVTSHIRQQSKAQGVSVTHTLSAALLGSCGGQLQVDSNNKPFQGTFEPLKLRLLVSIGLRGFASKSYLDVQSSTMAQVRDWGNGAMACAAGAVDYNIDVSSTVITRTFLSELEITDQHTKAFWILAKECKEYLSNLIEPDKWNFVPESIRLFDIGWKLVDIIQATEMESRNPQSLGRAYTCSVSNVGVVSFASPSSDDKSKRVLQVDSVFYGTSQSATGVFCQLSSITTDGKLNVCLQFPFPIITEEAASLFAYQLQRLLKTL